MKLGAFGQASFYFIFICTGLFAAPDLQPFWKTATGGELVGNGSAEEDSCTFLSEDKFLYTLNPQEGNIQRKRKTQGRVLSGPYTVHGGNVLVEHEKGFVGMYNKRADLVLTVPLPGKLTGPPCIDGRGIMYFATENGYLLSYTHSGRKRWSIHIERKIHSNPVMTQDGSRICVAAGDSLLWVSNSGRIQKNGVPYGTEKLLALFLLPGELMCMLFPDNFILVEETGRIIRKIDLPISFSCAGGAVYPEGFLALYSDRNTMLFYTLQGPEPRQFFSVNLLADGKAAGFAMLERYLLIGCDDWIVYGYKLPRELSVSPGRIQHWKKSSFHTDYSADTEVLKMYAESGRRRELILVIEEIEQRILDHTIQGEDLSILHLLEEVTDRKHGEFAGSKTDYDELADIRSRAIVLMGKLGNLETQEKLTGILSKEHHPDVQKAAIYALGLLQSDPSGDALAVVRRISKRNNTIEKDISLTSEILFFAAAVKRYHGLPVSGDLFSILYEIFLEDYPRKIRKAALELMEMS